MRACTVLTLGVVGLLAGIWCFVHWNSAAHIAVESGWQSETLRVHKDVDYHYFCEGSPILAQTRSDALVLDVDLQSPTVRLQVTADNPVRRKGGKVFGISHTVRDWCVMNREIAGINGGFFGQTDGVNKQAEGLLAVAGKVYNSGRWIK